MFSERQNLQKISYPIDGEDIKQFDSNIQQAFYCQTCHGGRTNEPYSFNHRISSFIRANTSHNPDYNEASTMANCFSLGTSFCIIIEPFAL